MNAFAIATHYIKTHPNEADEEKEMEKRRLHTIPKGPKVKKEKKRRRKEEPAATYRDGQTNQGSEAPWKLRPGGEPTHQPASLSQVSGNCWRGGGRAEGRWVACGPA